MKNKLIRVLLVSIFIIATSFAADSRRAPRDTKLLTPNKQSIEILKTAISSTNPMIRMEAIEAIALSGSSRLYPLIEERLSDTVDAVRFVAIIAIGDIRYNQATEKLNIFFEKGNENERVAASYAFLKLGDSDPEYHRILVKALQSSDNTISANAALVMGKLGSQKYIGLLKWVLQNRSGDDKTQIQAVDSLSQLGYDDIDSKAWSLMISKRADDRVMGIIAMYNLATYDSRNAIKTMLDDDVLEVRIVAAGRLAALRDDTGFDVIKNFFNSDLRTLSGEDRSRALIHAIDAIRFSKNLELAQYLPQFLTDKDETVKIHSALAILSI